MSEDKKKKSETSLDAFFEPAEEEVTKEKEHKYYPVDKEKLGEIPAETITPAEEAPEEKKAEKKKGKKTKEKTAGKTKIPIIIAIAVLGVIVLAGAGYLGAKLILKTIGKKTEKTAKTITTTKPKPPKPVPVTPSAPKPSEKVTTPSAPVKPETAQPQKTPTPTTQTPAPAQPLKTKTEPTPIKPSTPAQPAPSTKPAIPQPSPKPVPQPSIPIPSYPSGTGWSCQVEADILAESMNDTISKLKNLGFNNIYYIDTTRTLRIYHLYLIGSFDQNTAEQQKNSLMQIGFKPRLEQKGSQFRVIVYSYGKNSIAQNSKAKVEKAGLGPCEIIPRTETVVLHQIRIGPYPSLTDARFALQKLRANNFEPALVEEK